MRGMGNLADHIEAYLRELLTQAAQGVVEIQRRELAARFGCAPSQINYVLETRFTTERGYIVESRRGEGGYIRIIRCGHQPRRDLHEVIEEEIGDAISQREAEETLRRMAECGMLSEAEVAMVRHILAVETSTIASPLGDVIRAIIFRSVLRILLARASGPS